MMRLALILLLFPTLVQSTTEQDVLRAIREMMTQSGGRVTFSDLHNSPNFTSEQKAFLGRLYEIFFQVPHFLRDEYSSSGRVPTKARIAENFAITKASVDLLLAVMKSDPRVPSLFEFDPATREIASIDLANIDAFIARRGDSFKVTDWVGQGLPDFSLQKLDGGTIGSQDLKGSPALVYFWFTGCPPCAKISPHLVELDKRYRSRGLRIVGVNADRVLGLGTTDEQRRAYLEKSGVEFVNAHLDAATRQAFGGIAIFPTLFFVDPSGTIGDHFLNYQPLDTLRAAATKVLGSAR